MPDRFSVLLVDDDPRIRSYIGHGLELEGVEAISTESFAQAQAVIDEPFEAAILNPWLPDGRVESLLNELLHRLPRSRIIVQSSGEPIAGLPAVKKGDLRAIADLLELHQPDELPPAAKQARRALGRVHRQWLELCEWDPLLPPGTRPPIAESVISAVNSALERPQPLGWGLDPALEPVADAFGLNVGEVPNALAELVCLREAFTQVVIGSLEEDQIEALRRLQMIIDRTMLVVTETSIRRLAKEALTDPLTGLGNRRAFDQDLAREVARFSRGSSGQLTVAVLDVNGLKRTNDTLGHPAGDQLLRQLANAITSLTRATDRGYRLGGDEFALLLEDTHRLDAESIEKRLETYGAPSTTVGTSSLPQDHPDRLVELADERLYERRRRAERPGSRSR